MLFTSDKVSLFAKEKCLFLLLPVFQGKFLFFSKSVANPRTANSKNAVFIGESFENNIFCFCLFFF